MEDPWDAGHILGVDLLDHMFRVQGALWQESGGPQLLRERHPKRREELRTVKGEASEWWVQAHGPNAKCSSAYLSLRWPRFRGPGFLFCFECRDPMGRGVPPGNKILVWVKKCKSREKGKMSWSHHGQKTGVSLGGGPGAGLHTKPWSLLTIVFLHHHGNNPQHWLIGTQKPF